MPLPRTVTSGIAVFLKRTNLSCMHRPFHTFLLALLGALFVAGCGISFTHVTGNRQLASQTRTVEAFQGVVLAGSMDLVYTPSARRSLRIEGESNLLPYVLTEVDDGELKVYVKDHADLETHQPLTVYVSGPAVHTLTLAGSGNLSTQGLLAPSDHLNLTLAGSGDLRVDSLNCPLVELKLAGSGDLYVSGDTRTLNLKLVGSGNIHARGLRSEDAHTTIAGSGDADIYVSQNLQSNIVGSGNLNFWGSPTSVSNNGLGSGSTHAMKE